MILKAVCETAPAIEMAKETRYSQRATTLSSCVTLYLEKGMSG